MKLDLRLLAQIYDPDKLVKLIYVFLYFFVFSLDVLLIVVSPILTTTIPHVGSVSNRRLNSSASKDEGHQGQLLHIIHRQMFGRRAPCLYFFKLCYENMLRRRWWGPQNALCNLRNSLISLLGHFSISLMSMSNSAGLLTSIELFRLSNSTMSGLWQGGNHNSNKCGSILYYRFNATWGIWEQRCFIDTVYVYLKNHIVAVDVARNSMH